MNSKELITSWIFVKKVSDFFWNGENNSFNLRPDCYKVFFKFIFYNESNEYTELTEKLIDLAYEFDGIDINYTYEAPIIDKEKKLTIINESRTPPFELSKDTAVVEEATRLKYRYLDLRSERLQKNMM